MQFKNLPTNLKITSLLMVLAAATGASAIYATMQMSSIDQTYTELVDGSATAAGNMARGRRGLTGVIVAIYENATAATEKGNTDARELRQKEEAFFLKRIDEAKANMPSLSAPRRAG